MNDRLLTPEERAQEFADYQEAQAEGFAGSMEEWRERQAEQERDDK